MDYGKCKVPEEVQLARGNGRPCQPCVQLSHIILIYRLSNCSYLYRLLNYPKNGYRINCSISQSFPGLLDAQLLKSSYWILSLLKNRWGVLKDVQQLGVSLASRNLSAIQKAGVLEVSVVSQRIPQAWQPTGRGKVIGNCTMLPRPYQIGNGIRQHGTYSLKHEGTAVSCIISDVDVS